MSNYLHITDDADNDCDAEGISKVAKRTKAECQQLKTDGSTYATRIPMNTALAECSDSLLALVFCQKYDYQSRINADSHDRQHC